MDPKNPKMDETPIPSSSERPILDEAQVAGNTREKVEEKLERKGIYPPEEKFDFEREVEKRYFSDEAVAFLREFEEAQAALRDLYEHNVYSYIHTVQMLNQGCILIRDNIDDMRDLLMKKGGDARFEFPEENLRTMFLGAIVFHDWGKKEVDNAILDHAGFLEDDMFREMAIHPMATLNHVASRVIDPEEAESPARVKKALTETLNQAGFSKEKMLLLMAYAVASHHCFDPTKEGKFRKFYPPREEIEAILPDYIAWFNTYGEEFASILAILDINDAIRSERSYKPAHDEKFTEDQLTESFLNTSERKRKYGNFVASTLASWTILEGSDNYTKHRKGN